MRRAARSATRGCLTSPSEKPALPKHCMRLSPGRAHSLGAECLARCPAQAPVAPATRGRRAPARPQDARRRLREPYRTCPPAARRPPPSTPRASRLPLRWPRRRTLRPPQVNGRVLVFGGERDNGVLDDMWSLRLPTAPLHSWLPQHLAQQAAHASQPTLLAQAQAAGDELCRCARETDALRSARALPSRWYREAVECALVCARREAQVDADPRAPVAAGAVRPLAGGVRRRPAAAAVWRVPGQRRVPGAQAQLCAVRRGVAPGHGQLQVWAWARQASPSSRNLLNKAVNAQDHRSLRIAPQLAQGVVRRRAGWRCRGQRRRRGGGRR